LLGLIVVPLLLASVLAAFFTPSLVPLAYQYLIVLSLAYLIGSVPWGYFLVRWARGVDVREYGSGRTGMTNVLRTGGGRMAAAALALDLGKGLVAVLLAREVLGTTSGEVAAGLLALIGHNWPVFLNFKGGRGIATGMGALAVIAPLSAIIGMVVFVPVTLMSRYLSLGSVTGVITASMSLLALAVLGVYSTTHTWYAVIGGVVIIWQHRDNIQRLMHGTERRLGVPAVKIDGSIQLG
jgi:glycerol-3-phosphate acyltransferase PlsY